MKAIYESNYVQVKDGAGKGKVFHIYSIIGSKDELKEFTSSPQFKKYPRNNKVTGAPQLVTMYMDPLRDELPLYKKENGDFTLDGSETRKDVGRLEALAKISTAMESAFATKLVERMERPKGLMERMKAEESAESTPAELDKI